MYLIFHSFTLVSKLSYIIKTWSINILHQHKLYRDNSRMFEEQSFISLHHVYSVRKNKTLMSYVNCNILYKGGSLQLNICASYMLQIALSISFDIPTSHVGLERNMAESGGVK
jgi:hypothetical protein